MRNIAIATVKLMLALGALSNPKGKTQEVLRFLSKSPSTIISFPKNNRTLS
jgi:hypothetical protein